MSTTPIRYLVVALGGPDDPAEDADVEAALDYVSRVAAPFAVRALNERACRVLTAALLYDPESAVIT